MDQFNIFDFTSKPFKITNKIRLIELFGGIGSQAMALRDLGADFERYRLVEFDDFCIKAYNKIHGTQFVKTDIRDVHGADLGITETDKYTYIMFYSFPCTDLSVAGQMQGMAKGSGTRSGLLWEVERLLNECDELPQVLIMENVPQVHGEANRDSFKDWIRFLESRGYENFIDDLNAKDYGVAQSRDRCFMVSVPKGYSYKFPKPIELPYVMKDYLEDDAEERFFLTSDKAKELIEKLIDNGTIERERERELRPCDLTTAEPKGKMIANTIMSGCRGIMHRVSQENGCVVQEVNEY